MTITIIFYGVTFSGWNSIHHSIFSERKLAILQAPSWIFSSIKKSGLDHLISRSGLFYFLLSWLSKAYNSISNQQWRYLYYKFMIQNINPNFLLSNFHQELNKQIYLWRIPFRKSIYMSMNFKCYLSIKPNHQRTTYIFISLYLSLSEPLAELSFGIVPLV